MAKAIASGLDSAFGDARSIIRKNFGLTIGVTLGFATKDFVKGIVDHLVMPLLSPVFEVLGGDSWADFVVDIGPFSLPLGALITDVVTYSILVIALYIFINVFFDSKLISGGGK
jgi:large-conductance mechanosensitive channel|tara:strand:- start:105 stop:446 length:342 start_codon:yes stop_codon:yes gene_type:complete